MTQKVQRAQAGRIPPHAADAEAALLGAILLERDKLDEVLTIIQDPEAFYEQKNGLIFEAIAGLYKSGDVVDLVTVTQQLVKNGTLEQAGGGGYITNLTFNVVTSAHAEAHARLIIEKYMLRRAIVIAADLLGEGYDNSTDPFELIVKF